MNLKTVLAILLGSCSSRALGGNLHGLVVGSRGCDTGDADVHADTALGGCFSKAMTMTVPVPLLLLPGLSKVTHRLKEKLRIHT